MAKTDNLTDFLTNTANAIRMAEGSTAAINPQDFEAKITALKLSVQTADANATAADILSGKTAWVNGTKIAGSIGTKAATTIIPGTSDQTIASGVYIAGAQTIKGDANLIADNIKSGTSIFGVTGSYAGSSPNLQSKSVTYTSNGTATVTPDSGYDGLSSVDVTVDVASEGGGGAGFSVTFPATATNWNQLKHLTLFLYDGSNKKITDYSTIANKKVDGIVGMSCGKNSDSFVLKMTLSLGSIMQAVVCQGLNYDILLDHFSITQSGGSTYTPYYAAYMFWWPLSDIVLSSIEMYDTD